MSTLYLVDGSNFLFRAFHAMPPMVTSTGVPTGAVRGLANMLLRLLGEYQPSHIAVVFDAGGRDKRAERLAAYKQNRKECPPELVPQFDLARRLVGALGVRSLNATDAEADDVIATLARKAQKAQLKVVIASSDKDLMQLCSEGEICLLDTMKDEGRGKLYGPAEVVEKFGVPPQQLGDVLALMGDSSDNLPGVPGIGPKTAAQLIQSFGSIDELLRRIDEINVRGKDKVQAALRANSEQLRLVRELVALDEDVPAAPELAELSRQPVHRSELLMLMQELEFNTLHKRLTQPGGVPGMPDLSDEKVTAEALGPGGTGEALAPGGAGESGGLTAAADPGQAPPPASVLIDAVPAGCTVVLTADELAQAVAAIRGRLAAEPQAWLAVVPQWCEDPRKGHNARLCPLTGLALAIAGTMPLYLPFAHRYLGAPAQLTALEVFAALAPILEDPAVRKAVYGAKETFAGLRQHGQALRGVATCPALCSYLLDPAQSHELPALIERHLPPDYPKLPSREALCQSGKHRSGFDTVELSRAAELAGAEARAVLIAGEGLLHKLDPAGQRLLSDLELPLAQVLAEIEAYGVLLDVGVLRQLSAEAETRLRALEAEIAGEAGVTINLNSPKQLAELLFDRLGLVPGKKNKGKSGHSVDAEVLETLAAEHPIARKILEHRSLSKLKGTYLDQFPLLCDPASGRLHTCYQQVVAATGRLSSTEPNLQNIPIRTELGAKIRRAFIAPPGHLLIAADYSQIELRVLAHLSGDELLCTSFASGDDIHTRTAIEMFGPTEGATSDKRRVAKMINYGIVYGLSDYGLAVRLSIERRLAKQYIEEYFARYKGVKDFMDELVLRARRDGGARTLLGRFRPLADLTTRNYAARAYAERIAKNTPIQGTAADILKQAMINVQTELARSEPTTRMLLTVHDELVLEAPEDRQAAVSELVKTAMERAATLRVPLRVEIGAAQSWADC